jgi:hypothetical protein
MVRIRLVRMSGSHMTLRSRTWQRWLRPRQYPEGTQAEQRTHQQRPMRREVGMPIGRHWELRFSWYDQASHR